MGLTKQYLRYISSGNFNLIASKGCNVNFVPLEGQEGRFVACGGCENVFIWDMRLGQKVYWSKFQSLLANMDITYKLAQRKEVDLTYLGFSGSGFERWGSNGDLTVHESEQEASGSRLFWWKRAGLWFEVCGSCEHLFRTSLWGYGSGFWCFWA